MAFGCLTLWERRNCISLSDVTEKYEIGHTLRVKEFCELCVAKERLSGKVFFCKKFLKKDGRKVRKAAKNEIMILNMVRHPNILQLIDTFETRKEYFIIQELATGGDVFDWILDQGNYTERDASCVIRQVLEAVAYLHSLSIVHRNLKLENLIYYTENNHNKVVLRDFYLSRFENNGITEPCGTPEYLAPEVVARRRYGCPIDCWAVGVIMFILLSGNPPFYDETEEDDTDQHNRILFCRIVAGEFEFDSPYWDDISPAAKELVCKLMEVDPMLRVTAQNALTHDWIAGQGASEKNLKDGVCAQFKKNFAKAKWRKAIRVTTFMQRLRSMESSGGPGDEDVGAEVGDEAGGKGDVEEVASGSTVELSKGGQAENKAIGEKEGGGENGDVEKVRGDTCRGGTRGGGAGEIGSAKPQALLKSMGEGTDTNSAGGKKETVTGTGEAMMSDDRASSAYQKTYNSEGMKDSCGAVTQNCQKREPVISPQLNDCSGPTAMTVTPTAVQKIPSLADKKMPDVSTGTRCQSQLPGAMTGISLNRSEDLKQTSSNAGEDGGDLKLSMSTRKGENSCTLAGSPGLGNNNGASGQKQGEMPSPGLRCSPCPSGATSLDFGKAEGRSSDWQMDSAIEQIEKHMAAVFEKMEEDLPSLLDHIAEPPKRGT
ncbi:caM kinase-like vesicle-associated protein isoform X2 [Brienomyrus brachyistius]|nr:caM kinase-like vesicle-associated protein isoform X2 [Brienomyrus brachyistius]XP_048874384.1 caM kinase-like vesicle-associated protein isoform X2 [Brienomyrus brachyistius]